MGTIKVKDRQTVLDLAIATSGSVETAIEFAIANGISLTSELKDGDELRTVGVRERSVFAEYERDGVSPATEASEEDREAMPYGGIGLMSVGIDFEVN